MMNCHHVNTQLERIQQAKVGAGERLSIGGSSGLEEQLRAIELAISNIRDEMWRRKRPRLSVSKRVRQDVKTDFTERL
jgi:hypothetical protein